MKEGAALSSMGEIETIYEGGCCHDMYRIRSSQEVDASCCIDGIIGSMTVGMIEIIEVITTIDNYLSKS
jgi:hypothetical protein